MSGTAYSEYFRSHGPANSNCGLTDKMESNQIGLQLNNVTINVESHMGHNTVVCGLGPRIGHGFSV